MTLIDAREQAALSIQRAQQHYKKYNDKKTTPNTIRWTEWVMIRFPQDETGNGPYMVIEVTATGSLAEKVYTPQDGEVQVHLERVTQCPSNFPAGYYWYGPRRQGPGHSPKWLVKLQQKASTEPDSNQPEPRTVMESTPETTDSDGNIHEHTRTRTRTFKA